MHLRLLSLARDSRAALAATILVGLFAGLLTIGQARLVSTTVNGVFLQGQTLAQVSNWMRLLLILLAARGLLIWIQETAASSVAVEVKQAVQVRLFQHILALGPAYARGERTGELTATAVEGVEALDSYFSQYLPQLSISVLVPLTILIVVFPVDPLSGLILLVTAPLIPFFMYMIGRGAEAAARKQYGSLSRLASYFLDSLQGLTTLKLFGQSRAQAQNIARMSDKFRVSTLKVMQASFLSAFALELLATISTAIIAVEVGLRVLYGRMQFSEGLFLLILAPEFYLPLRMLGMRFHAGLASMAAARRIFQILDVPVEERQRTAEVQQQVQCKPDISPFDIDLKDVSYSYASQANLALDKISLHIQAGQYVALVGASGSGKSTLVGLLLGFMEPNSGRLRIGPRAAKDDGLEKRRRLMAWVPQHPHLFHDSIAANLRIGNPDATDEDLASAARAAHLEGFIESLPEKYDTSIGEAGARLSSGQAQRLALARAFLKDAPILILDEPTSSLDPENESLLEDSTRRLANGRTVITIAHRLNTAFQADRIIVLNAGRVAESGTHRELLRLNGAYAEFVKAGMQRWGDPCLSRSAAANAPVGMHQDRADGDTRTSTPRGSDLVQQRVAVPTSAVVPQAMIFTRLLSFVRGAWPLVFLSVLLGGLTVGSSVALMGTSAWLISAAALHPSIAALAMAVVGVRFFGIARAVFRYLERLVSHGVTFRLLRNVRVWFYEKLEPLAPAVLMNYRTGDLLSRAIGDVDTLEHFYVRILSPPMTAACVAIGAGAFLAAHDLRLAISLIGFSLVVGLVLPGVVQAVSRRTAGAMIACRATLHHQLVDGIQGIADILAFGVERKHLESVRATGRAYAAAQRRIASLNGVHSGLSAFITNLALWCTFYLAIPLVTSNKIQGTFLASLALVTLSAFEAITPLPLAAQWWSAVRAAGARLFDIADTSPAVNEAGHDEAGEQATRNGCPGRGLATADIELKVSDLSFTYSGETNPALQHVTFKLPTGGSLGVVGPSGAGKSTLANLLLRFWPYNSGEIRLCGTPLEQLPADQVRERIAFVSQNAYFFNTSIYENLRMAGRGVTMRRIEDAARAAQIHDFIEGLPDGYETLVGEQGVRLSAGERQRLAVARALIKDAPILILDEPTANLDTITEAEVLRTLFKLIHGKTTLLITHRLVGLENMDEILVLSNGAVVEHGSHGSLLQQAGLYRRLWELQNRIWGET